MHTSIDLSVRQQARNHARQARYRALVVLLCATLVLAGAIFSVLSTTTTSALKATAHKIISQRPTSEPASRSQPRHTQRPRISHATGTSSRPEPTKTPAPPTPTFNYPIYSGNTDLPEIALTFDDGPNPFYTPQILAILQQYEIKATFFDIGYLVEDYPALVRQEYNAGNTVADHSWSHPDLTRLSAGGVRSQLAAASDVIRSVIGVPPTFFRPPYGAFDSVVMQQAGALNLSAIIWNDEARDWLLPGVNVIIHRILALARNGAIILLHDGGGNRAQTVAALPTIISTLLARGFHFVTIQQLVRDISIHANTSLSAPPVVRQVIFTLSPSTARRNRVRIK